MITASKPVRPKHFLRKGCLIFTLAALVLCLGGSAASFWSNLSLPVESVLSEQIDSLDKFRLEEALRLKAGLGDDLWPGFAQDAIPISLHDRQVSFLFGYPGEPPPAWERVPADSFQGLPYYRKAEADPQNFAIQVGDTWVAGMATKTTTDIFLIQVYRDILPSALEPIFPYRLLIQPSETQIAAVIHESFHVYQAHQASQRLQAAEDAHKLGERYWAVDPAMRPSWKEEAALLSEALSARTDEQARQLAARFLVERQQRRQEASLSAELVDYERWLEWEEGLAKYAEIKILQLAYQSAAYQPLDKMSSDPDFKAYRGFKRRWSQENMQLKLQAGKEGEVRFYQTGLAMAYLLDRLAPAWKVRAMDEGVFLEDLLQEAVK